MISSRCTPCGGAANWSELANARNLSAECWPVVQVARAGDHRGYLDQMRVTWGDAATAMGPNGAAIRTGEIQGCRDVQHDPQAEPWRAAAFDGALNVYGAEVGEFDQEAQTMLAELAGDISQCLARLLDRAKRADALVNGIDLLAATVKTRDTYAVGHQSDDSTGPGRSPR